MAMTHSFFIDTKKPKDLARIDITRIIDALVKDGIHIDESRSWKHAICADFGTRLPLREPFTKKEVCFAYDVLFDIPLRGDYLLSIKNRDYRDGYEHEHSGVFCTLDYLGKGSPNASFDHIEESFKNAYSAATRPLAEVIPFPKPMPQKEKHILTS